MRLESFEITSPISGNIITFDCIIELKIFLTNLIRSYPTEEVLKFNTKVITQHQPIDVEFFIRVYDREAESARLSYPSSPDNAQYVSRVPSIIPHLRDVLNNPKINLYFK